MSILERARAGRQERAELRALPVCPSCGHVSASHQDGSCATDYDMGFGDSLSCECANPAHTAIVTEVQLYAQ